MRFLVIFLIIASSFAQERKVLKERLSYRLYWSFIPVAYAKLETYELTDEKNKKTFLHTFEVKTGPIVEKIYKVKTVISSLMNAERTRSLYYKKEQEENGKYRKDYIDFQWDKKKAYFYRFEKLDATLDLETTEQLVDPLAIMFFLRSNFKNKPLEMNLTDGRKILNKKLNYTKIDKVKIANHKWGYLFQPNLENFRGIFKKSPNAVLNIWLSTDGRLTPLQIKSKVSVGSFKAVLKKIETF